MLTDCPTLHRIVDRLNRYLGRRYPDYFGRAAKHPVRRIKPYKVIHDNIWGTNRYSWRELAIIDSPILQRLRDIHQVGLAYQVYPCAHHTRFEHSLGVVTVASRAFDALIYRHAKTLETIANELQVKSFPEFVNQLREELRLAALLHDVGHSLFSHASEQVYGDLPLMRNAVRELRTLVGVKKGAGEVISFCVSQTKALRGLLERAYSRLPDRFKGGVQKIDLDNISLLIVGRSKHPYMQFMADIISSDLDADKLDYLLRDAAAAGLPLRYDLERYLYSVGIAAGDIPDGDGYLQKLYSRVGTEIERKTATERIPYPHYETYRLRLPQTAMNTIEQIIICKFMLFSYIYHHRKVRSAEGLLAAMLRRFDGLEGYWQVG
jgi:HD superfamily phosphohydrolase